MKKILIKNGQLVSKEDNYLYDKKDILIEGNTIKAIENTIEASDEMEVHQLNNSFISSGFIDVHCHIDKDTPLELSISPDEAGIKSGNSTVIDAGTCGFATFEKFLEKSVKVSKTNIYALLNLSSHGIDAWEELKDISRFDTKKMKEIVEKYPDKIVGIKARCDNQPLGGEENTENKGKEVFQLCQKLARELKLPFVIHIGEAPPEVKQLLCLAQEGDIFTHCYTSYAPNGRHNSFLDEEGIVLAEVFEAKQRGVLFDIGHGVSSFDFNIAKKAFAQGFYPDFIGTDIHCYNVNGPVFSLAHTVNKVMHLGMDLIDCIHKITAFAAESFNLEQRGRLKVGYKADLSVFRIEDKEIELVDSVGNKERANKNLAVDYVYVEGQRFKVL